MHGDEVGPRAAWNRGGFFSVTLLVLEVAREDIEALGARMDEPAERGQPAATESTVGASAGGTAQPVTVFSAKSWITNEVTQMRAAGEIIASHTALAEELAKRMKNAARISPAIRPVSQGYIRAQLYEWGLVTPRRHRR